MKMKDLLFSTKYYLNEDKTYTQCDLLTWSRQFEEMSRNGTKHLNSDIIDGRKVSTIWLGLNHNFYEGKPLIFETMVFESGKGGNDIYMERYSTWDEAVEGHKKAIEWVKAGCHEMIE